MSLEGVIRRPDKGPLGSADEVKYHLSEAFPGVQFEYVPEEPHALSAVRLPIFLRLWLAVFGRKTPYPHHFGFFQRAQGGTVEFYFAADEPVTSIRATSYGLTAGLDDNFDRLYAATGWMVKYPRF